MQAMIFKQPEAGRAALLTDVVDTRWGILRKGMSVWGRDGKIGRLVLIVRDRHTHEPSHLVVQRGWLWGRQLLIPLHWTIDTLNKRINLNVRQWQLAHLREYRSDAQITRDVRRAIYTNRTLAQHSDCAAIVVHVQHGIVTLRGNVRDGARRVTAQAIVHRVPGAQEVRNELVADDDLQRRAEQAIAQDAMLRDLPVEVVMSLGYLSLRGSVTTRERYERLIFAVRQVDGVRAIWDELAIGTPAREPQMMGTFIGVRQDWGYAQRADMEA